MINCIGVNISERKSGTERTIKRKKRESVKKKSPPGFFPSYDNPGYHYPALTWPRTESQVNKQAKHTTFYNLSERISIAEQWKLVAESSEFHFTLSRAHILCAFFPTRNTQKKRDILRKKRESGMTLKKRECTPESDTVDTYATG